MLRTAVFIAIGVAASVLGLVGYATHALQRLELSSVDTRFSVRGRQATPQDVVVVAIDEDTFTALNRRFSEFTRGMYAQVIDNLHAAGAKVIALDIQFTEQTRPPPYLPRSSRLYPTLAQLAQGDDNALGFAAIRAHPVLFAATAADSTGATNVFGGNLAALDAVAGFSAFPPDADGVLRRMPYEESHLRSFALTAADLFTGRKIGTHGHTAWIDYRGPPGTIATIPFWRVLENRFRPSEVRGKVAIVGGTAQSLQDLHASSTSGGGTESGPEIQANAVDTAIRGFPLRDAPTELDVLAIFVLGLAPALLGRRFSAITTVLGAVAIGAAYAVVAQVAFNHGIVLAVVYPLGALGIAAVATLAAQYVLTAFERQRTRDTFARFVPKAVVDQVLSQTSGGVRLGGVRVVGTCMFTDLRDSTKFAETLAPETVVEVVNRYLGELSEAILGHGGTLMSYLGDGFMAVFGAPLEQRDHADRALAAAREILDVRLPRFNAWFSEHGYGDAVRIGIGLNSGEFLAGNVGSETRLEYTAMGDTINTASRLETATKTAAFSMLMAGSTREALTDRPDDLVDVGEIEIRGRDAHLHIWSIESARKEASHSVPSVR